MYPYEAGILSVENDILRDCFQRAPMLSSRLSLTDKQMVHKLFLQGNSQCLGYYPRHRCKLTTTSKQLIRRKFDTTLASLVIKEIYLRERILFYKSSHIQTIQGQKSSLSRWNRIE
jgi:hypothetical protein